MALLLILIALAGGGWWLMMPPSPQPAGPLPQAAATARGAYHVHSSRSDGGGSVDDIAAAAAAAGLQFVIVTDHGDGMRKPDAARYADGVLVIDAVELNTASGHLVALNLPATPYPFAGAAADVLEDVHRLGGFGIAAHPDSPRPALQWQAWDAPIDGIEWINADSAWRDDGAGTLARAVAAYGLRPAGALATLLDRPEALLARWDLMGAARSLPALAAADAHARVSLRDGAGDPDPGSWHVPLPGYEAVFRAFSNHVILGEPLSGDAGADAAAILAAIRNGRVFTVVDALATPGGLEFSATSAAGVAHMGDVVESNGPVSLMARVGAPAGATLVLLRNGTAIQQTADAVLEVAGVDAGVYRIEVRVPGAPGTPPLPWLLSNPIYVGQGRATAASVLPSIPLSRIPARTGEAAVEKGAGDASELFVPEMDGARARRFAGEPPIGWRYRLSDGNAVGQFAAVQLPITGGLAGFDSVRFTVRSAGPVRVWVQLRAGSATERWGRTFYAGEDSRVIDLPLRGFQSIGATSSQTPPLERIESLLFVADTLNHRPGASGTITIAEVAFVR